jgi:hypothetical protein
MEKVVRMLYAGSWMLTWRLTWIRIIFAEDVDFEQKAHYNTVTEDQLKKNSSETTENTSVVTKGELV